MARKAKATATRRIASANRASRQQRRGSLARRTLDARPDTLDFRDLMFTPTLVEVPTRRLLADYRKVGVPILDQGTEGACTGFGLATTIHYLLRIRRIVSDKREVSPRMLYNMARRYDEWPGETYSGSSARGAMKGWHKHGVCSSDHWVYSNFEDEQDLKLFGQRYTDALRRPLGAYFRVNHRDIVAMHAAVAETGILYATAQVHDGWDEENISAAGLIDWSSQRRIQGGHAFAIVGYDEKGFWIQNSWGKDWALNGYAQVTYDDWLANGSDVWVARLGAPIILSARESASRGVGVAAQGTRSYLFCDLRPHIISLGNNGALRAGGTYGNTAEEVRELFQHISTQVGSGEGMKRLLLYAHGGLTAEDSAIQKVADLRAPPLAAGIYPISLVWRTDFWTTLRNMLQDAITRRRPEGFLDDTKDFMLDRLDDALEPIARTVGGKNQWDEMKENAVLASGDNGGLLIVLEEIRKLFAQHPSLELHMVGHSAGAILLGGLIRAMAATDPVVTSCTLWAPACTMQFYRDYYMPALQDDRIDRFSVFALTDRAELDDNCANIYHKSLLYLISHAFEQYLRQPGLLKGIKQTPHPAGEPILGMAKWIDSELKPAEKTWDLVLSPNTEPEGSRGASRSTAHGAFDDDAPTLKATLARMLNRGKADATFGSGRLRSQATNRGRREALMAQSGGAGGLG